MMVQTSNSLASNMSTSRSAMAWAPPKSAPARVAFSIESTMCSPNSRASASFPLRPMQSTFTSFPSPRRARKRALVSRAMEAL